MIPRKPTKLIIVGDVKIGAQNPIVIQSMTKTDTRDVPSTLLQISKLHESGCEIARLAVLDKEAANALKEIVKQSKIPIVADVHFDYKLAIAAMENGVHKLRINPGNIGSIQNVKKVMAVAKERKIPIRIGVNSGSIDPKIRANEPDMATALTKSAMSHINILNSLDFDDICISVKSSNANTCLLAYKKLSEICDYPLHVGVTESGSGTRGRVVSAIGIASILNLGIGDTIRVSLTENPVEEIVCAKEILKALGLRKFGVDVYSCPTCGRTEVDLTKIAKDMNEKCKLIKKNITVAIMGCFVNGPGEARDADIGVACGRGQGIIFKKGQVLRKVPEEIIIEELMREINEL